MCGIINAVTLKSNYKYENGQFKLVIPIYYMYYSSKTQNSKIYCGHKLARVWVLSTDHTIYKY